MMNMQIVRLDFAKENKSMRTSMTSASRVSLTGRASKLLTIGLLRPFCTSPT